MLYDFDTSTAFWVSLELVEKPSTHISHNRYSLLLRWLLAIEFNPPIAL